MVSRENIHVTSHINLMGLDLSLDNRFFANVSTPYSCNEHAMEESEVYRVSCTEIIYCIPFFLSVHLRIAA
jgi:hypothetical protein